MNAAQDGSTKRFDILVTALPNPRARSILARHLALDPSVSLEKAISMLGSLPVYYSRDIPGTEAKQQRAILERLGVRYRIVESQGPPERPANSPPPAPSPVPEPPQTVLRVASPSLAHARTHAAGGPLTFGVPPKPKGKWRAVAQGVSAVVVILVMALVLYRVQERRTYRLGQGVPPPAGGRAATGANRATQAVSPGDEAVDGTRASASARGGRAAVSSQSREQATLYVDSATAGGDDWGRAIRFYRMALSFNEYNAGAWHGLINAYRQSGRSTEAAQAEARMRELFGENVFSVQNLVKPFGALSDFAQDAQGVCRLEYRSRVSARDALLRETFALTKALAVECRCRAVTIYASTGKGKGLLVYAKTDGLPATASRFEAGATVTYLD